MRRLPNLLIPAIALLSIALGSPGLRAQSGPSLPVLDGIHNGTNAQFGHISMVQEVEQKRRMLHYEICNLDTDGPLNAAWPRVGLATGWARPLPVGTCLTLTRDAFGNPEKFDAQILYTQARRPAPASAYLDDSSPDISSSGPWNLLWSELFSFYVDNNYPGEIKPLRLSYFLRNIDDERAAAKLTWWPGMLSLGLILDPIMVESGAIDTDELAKNGISFKFTSLDGFLTEEDYKAVGEAFADLPEVKALLGGPLLVLRREKALDDNEAGTVHAPFVIRQSGSMHPAITPILVVGGDGRLVAMAALSGLKHDKF